MEKTMTTNRDKLTASLERWQAALADVNGELMALENVKCDIDEKLEALEEGKRWITSKINMERKQSGGDKAVVIEKVVRREDASRKAPRQRR
jgi:hypothetical protein